MDVVCEGSSVKGGPAGRQAGIRWRVPCQAWLPGTSQVEEELHSPSFGISAINNLGTQCFHQHLSSAVLVVNSAAGTRPRGRADQG